MCTRAAMGDFALEREESMECSFDQCGRKEGRKEGRLAHCAESSDFHIRVVFLVNGRKVTLTL